MGPQRDDVGRDAAGQAEAAQLAGSGSDPTGRTPLVLVSGKVAECQRPAGRPVF